MATVLLVTQDIKDRQDVSLPATLLELKKLNDPGDFVVLDNGAMELRAAGPSNGVFFVQFENRSTKLLLECSNTSTQELERYISQFFDNDISFLREFRKPTRAWWPFMFVASILVVLLYEIAT